MIEDHPMPREHLAYVDEVLTEYVDVKLTKDTIAWIEDIQSQYQSLELVQYDTIFEQATICSSQTISPRNRISTQL